MNDNSISERIKLLTDELLRVDNYELETQFDDNQRKLKAVRGKNQSLWDYFNTNAIYFGKHVSDGPVSFSNIYAYELEDMTLVDETVTDSYGNFSLDLKRNTIILIIAKSENNSSFHTSTNKEYYGTHYSIINTSVYTDILITSLTTIATLYIINEINGIGYKNIDKIYDNIYESSLTKFATFLEIDIDPFDYNLYDVAVDNFYLFQFQITYLDKAYFRRNLIPYTRFRVFIDLISYYVFPRIVEESYIKNNALDEAIFYSNILNNIDNNFFSDVDSFDNGMNISTFVTDVLDEYANDNQYMSNDIITRLIRIGELYDRMTIVINENLDTIFESYTLEEFDFFAEYVHI